MLVISRKTNESIVIDGNITVSVLRVDHDNVRLGIEAPLEIPVLRKEIYEAIKTNNREAAGSAERKVKQVKVKQLEKNTVEEEI